MEHQLSDFRSYSYTVKKLGGDPTEVCESDYTVFFKKLEKLKVDVEFKVSEKDPSGRLHYHGIIYLPKGFYRKRLCCNGFHLKMDEIWNKDQWIKYIHKDRKFEEDDMDSEISIIIPKKKLF